MALRNLTANDNSGVGVILSNKYTLTPRLARTLAESLAKSSDFTLSIAILSVWGTEFLLLIIWTLS